MGIYDRDWYRQGGRRLPGWYAELDPVAKVILWIFLGCVVALVVMNFWNRGHDNPGEDGPEPAGDAAIVDPDIHDAVEDGNVRRVEQLLAEDPERVRAVAEKGRPDQPLHLAARKNNRPIAELLLRHNADVRARCENGATPLHVAAERGSVKVARLLLDHQAPVEAADDHGFTPLFTAARSRRPGSRTVATLLLGHGARLTPHTMLCLGMVDRFREYLQSDPKLVEEDPFAEALLTDAVLMIQDQIRQAPADGEPPARRAERVITAHKDILEKLIAQGAAVTDQGIAGEPPLLPALRLAHPALARLLLEHGALADASPDLRRRARAAAAQSPCRQEMEQLLGKYGVGPGQ